MNRKKLAAEKAELENKLKEIQKQLDNPDDLFLSIKSYSDICEELDEEELTIADFDFLHKDDRKKALATAKIRQAERLFNGNWKKNWEDHNQPKYYPYFIHNNNGGWSFSVSLYDCNYSFGPVAYFKDQKTSDFVGKLLIEEYKQTF